MDRPAYKLIAGRPKSVARSGGGLDGGWAQVRNFSVQGAIDVLLISDKEGLFKITRRRRDLLGNGFNGTKMR